MNTKLAKVLSAFLAIYIIWGSTYLAIRVVIESLPPFFMAGTRFLLGGAVLYFWARTRGATRVSAVHWRSAFVIGGFMLLGGHGAVVWAEQWVPSGLTSLLIATVPLWMASIDFLWNKNKPSARIVLGLALGFAGVAFLVASMGDFGANGAVFTGAIVVVAGAFLWAFGSLYSRSARLPAEPLLGTGMQMFSGGLLLLLASLIAGEYDEIRFETVSERSLAAWMYLVVFGAIIAFTCYIWLLKNVSTAKVSTYAYVNPVVAMVLGATVAGEKLTILNVAAAAIILASIVLTSTQKTKSPVKQVEKTVS
ncbi:MAG: EamA family transporter [Candidatus Bathyarchaeia archaeon]